MNSNRSHLVLLFLSSFFLTFVLFAWIFQGIVLEFFAGGPLVLHVNGKDFPMAIGELPFKFLLLSMALLLLNLVHEYFGLGKSFVLTLTGALILFVFWGLLEGIPRIAWLGDADSLRSVYQMMFDMSAASLLSMAGVLFGGFLSIQLLLAGLRKLTGPGYSIVHLFFSHALGFFILGLLYSFGIHFPRFEAGELLATAVTTCVQWFFLFLITMPCYYIIKLFVGILLGRVHRQELKEKLNEQRILGADFFESRKRVQQGNLVPHEPGAIS